MKPDGWKLYCEAFRALFPSPTVKPDDIVSPAALQEMVERLLSGSETIPEGWKLVPVEPTVAMIAAYKGALKEMIEALPKEQRNHKKPIREPFKCLGRWRAMLNAAPQATS